MPLREIFAATGGEVFTITPDATLRDAAQDLVRHGVGAPLVFERENHRLAAEMLGIITERDILRATAQREACLDKSRVAEVMSTKLITGSLDDRVEDVMGLMTRQRKRHLPVIAEGRLAGIVSIGDIVKAQHDWLAMENRFMKDYIHG